MNNPLIIVGKYFFCQIITEKLFTYELEAEPLDMPAVACPTVLRNITWSGIFPEIKMHKLKILVTLTIIFAKELILTKLKTLLCRWTRRILEFNLSYKDINFLYGLFKQFSMRIANVSPILLIVGIIRATTQKILSYFNSQRKIKENVEISVKTLIILS